MRQSLFCVCIVYTWEYKYVLYVDSVHLIKQVGFVCVQWTLENPSQIQVCFVCIQCTPENTHMFCMCTVYTWEYTYVFYVYSVHLRIHICFLCVPCTPENTHMFYMCTVYTWEYKYVLNLVWVPKIVPQVSSNRSSNLCPVSDYRVF